MARSKFFSMFGRPEALAPIASPAAVAAVESTAVVPDAAAQIATLTAQLEAAQLDLSAAQARLAEQTATAIETITAASATTPPRSLLVRAERSIPAGDSTVMLMLQRIFWDTRRNFLSVATVRCERPRSQLARAWPQPAIDTLRIIRVDRPKLLRPS